MTEFNHFHLVLSPNVPSDGTWAVRLTECPLGALLGEKAIVQPVVTPNELTLLRSRHGWPSPARLQSIGEKVWQSLMSPGIEVAFKASLADAVEKNRGLRVIVSLDGEEADGPAPGAIRLQELPVEALFATGPGFVATDSTTPVSRSLKYAPDIHPYHVAPPLRVLVVVATKGGPPAKQEDEKAAIEKALQNLVAAGVVEREFCEPATRSELQNHLLQKPGFHVLHFIGHGAFHPLGQDPTPQPHLCLEEGDESDPVDALTFTDAFLKNSGVRLVVMTACSSAAPTPAEVEESIGPLHGVAQTLVERDSGVSAVVAMQFDLESKAAVAFSKTFYTHLFDPGSKLDQVVSLCRKAMAGAMKGMGHRAWVTPVIYWRCIDGKVFEIVGKPPPPQVEVIKGQIKVYLEHIDWVRSQPPEVRAAGAGLCARNQASIEKLHQEWSKLLRQTLRLRGGPVTAGTTVECALMLRLQTMEQIGDVDARVRFPSDKVDYKSAAPGTDTPGNDPLTTPAPGDLHVVVQNVSKGAQWPPGVYELAKLTFEVAAGTIDPHLELSLEDATVDKGGAATKFEALSAFLYVT